MTKERPEDQLLDPRQFPEMNNVFYKAERGERGPQLYALLEAEARLACLAVGLDRLDEDPGSRPAVLPLPHFDSSLQVRSMLGGLGKRAAGSVALAAPCWGGASSPR